MSLLPGAEKNCILSYAGTRYRNGSPTAMPPSRFLKDMDSRYLSLPSALNGDERPERREVDRFSSGKRVDPVVYVVVNGRTD